MRLILRIIILFLLFFIINTLSSSVSAAPCTTNNNLCTTSDGKAGYKTCIGERLNTGYCNLGPNANCGGCYPVGSNNSDIFMVGSDRGINSQTELKTIVNNAIIIIFSLAALFVLVMLVIGGIQWILSGGDKDALLSARKRITHALIGLAILALVFLILTTIGRIVGFSDVFSISLPSLNQ